MPLYELTAKNLSNERSGPLKVQAASANHALAHAFQVRTGLRFDIDAKELTATPADAGSTEQAKTLAVDGIRDWMRDKSGPFGVSVLNPNVPYEDDSFVELRQLPDSGKGGFTFIFKHKGSGTVFQTVGKDRHELAVKIAAGQYDDIDPRNDETPVNLGEDATDE